MRKMKNKNLEDIRKTRSMEIWKIGNGKNGKFKKYEIGNMKNL